MKCENAMNRYMNSEDSGRIPFRVRIHTFFCPVCSAEIYLLISVFKSFEQNSIWKTESNITGCVMDRVQKKSVYSGKRISGFKWAFIGMVIFASILLINFSNSFLWLREQFGSLFIIPMSIVLGVLLTIYLMVLTLSNYERLEKYLQTIFKTINKL